MVHITKTKTKGKSSQKSNKNKLSYTKYANALSYLVSETPLGEINHKFSKLPKSLKRPNKKSVANIKKQYKKARTELIKIGFELPTVTQLASAWEANLEYEKAITEVHNEEPKLVADDVDITEPSYWGMFEPKLTADDDSIAIYNADLEMVKEIKDSLSRFAQDCKDNSPYIFGTEMPFWWDARYESVARMIDNVIALGKEHEFVQKWNSSSIADTVISASMTPSDNEASWDSIESFIIDFLNDTF